MQTFLKKNWKALLLGLIILLAGFFAGRWTIKPIEKTEYVKGETIRNTVYSEKLVPYKVEVPAKPTLPLKPDKIRIPGQPEIITLKVDTAQIIADYVKANSYKQTLFDNKTEGKLVIDAVVQYNLMKRLSYEFTPMQKQTTIEKRRVLTPFVSGSYNSFGYWGGGAGIYYYDVGVSAKYITDFKNKGYEIGLNYKF